ncbi:hypothetical protein Ancab_009280 [Ancistrocladus abbreviatus]
MHFYDQVLHVRPHFPSPLGETEVLYDEQKKLAQQQAHIKSQMACYENELARKRMVAENEQQSARNQELVKLQEESSIRQESARRATEEQIQAQHRQTEREKAEIEHETIKREKWVAAINTAFDHIGGGSRAILADQNKLAVTVGGITALVARISLTRGAKVIWSYVDRILGQPSLIRESSRGKSPWSGLFSRVMSKLSHCSNNGFASKNGNGFGDKRIEQLAAATTNTKAHQAPFQNMLFYGPPRTGKTMAPRELAENLYGISCSAMLNLVLPRRIVDCSGELWYIRDLIGQKKGLDYALMTGGDVAPLGAQAVTKIHQLFDRTKKSDRGLLLFIDKVSCSNLACVKLSTHWLRNKTYPSEAQRSTVNALLFQTGDQSKDIVVTLATNRPGDLDSAVADHEVLGFPLPGEEECFKLLKLYLDKYIAQAAVRKSGLLTRWFQKPQQEIEIKGLTGDILREAAAKTDGFSGREVAKLMASVQAAVYGSEKCILDPQLFHEFVDYKVAEKQQRRKVAAIDAGSS